MDQHSKLPEPDRTTWRTTGDRLISSSRTLWAGEKVVSGAPFPKYVVGSPNPGPLHLVLLGSISVPARPKAPPSLHHPNTIETLDTGPGDQGVRPRTAVQDTACCAQPLGPDPILRVLASFFSSRCTRRYTLSIGLDNRRLPKRPIAARRIVARGQVVPVPPTYTVDGLPVLLLRWTRT